MLRITAKTKLSPKETIKRALAFFGAGGYGLTIKEKTANYVCLEGGGGVVEVTTSIEKKGTGVEVVSREWDYQVKEFIRAIS